ncbi:MAG: polysaccharide biosynthesis protein [Myxococcales bacterium]|nr:polysaccharide biosynthesis protein [Myxococcales bacterium]
MILVHLMVFLVAYVGAFLIRFDFDVPPDYMNTMLLMLPVVLGIKLLVFYSAEQYSGWWRYVSLNDLVALMRAAGISALIFVAVKLLVFGFIRSYPRSVFLLDFVNTVVILGGLRVSIRLFREALADHQTERNAADKQRLLIVGAGDTAETLLREISKNSNLPYRPVALVDDDPNRQGLRIHGAPVVGSTETLKETVERYEIEAIIIAAPSASPAQKRHIFERCQEAGIRPKILPAIESVLSGQFSARAIKDVAIDDLLGRPPVKLDQKAIASYLHNKRVVVTGAGGSIGSEICRQVCRFEPATLIMIEQAENPLFFIERELRRSWGETTELVPVVANVCNGERLDALFEQHKPQVVLHAAAHKHVPLMEANPVEALRNNVLGTRQVARTAHRHGAESFVMISTDKAVNPTSVMGTSKRVAELYVQAMAATSDTAFISVRFGNVLGSNGSVVPIFKEQIRRGGPVTVTHPEMQRYFMTIPEATQLVLQAASTGDSGQVFVLDMGEPVKILDLARDLIKLSGLTPEDDVKIVFTGMRPGEKLFEELSLEDEEITRTRHDKIFIGDATQLPLDVIEAEILRMEESVLQGSRGPDVMRAWLKRLVPEYAFEPSPELMSALDNDTIHSDKVIAIHRT